MKEIINKAVRGGLDKKKCIITFFESFIFSHEFLKAYFGENEVCNYCGEINCDCFWKSNNDIAYLPDFRILSWQYHAQQLVLSEDRLEYLRRFL